MSRDHRIELNCEKCVHCELLEWLSTEHKTESKRGTGADAHANID